jgi:hypothetical protein
LPLLYFIKLNFSQKKRRSFNITAEHELSLNNSEVNDSNLHETSEEILNPEVMENDFDTRSETSEQHSQDVLSGGGSEMGIYQYELRLDKTNVMRLRPAWIQTSLRVCAV